MIRTLFFRGHPASATLNNVVDLRGEGVADVAASGIGGIIGTGDACISLLVSNDGTARAVIIGETSAGGPRGVIDSQEFEGDAQIQAVFVAMFAEALQTTLTRQLTYGENAAFRLSTDPQAEALLRGVGQLHPVKIDHLIGSARVLDQIDDEVFAHHGIDAPDELQRTHENLLAWWRLAPSLARNPHKLRYVLNALALFEEHEAQPLDNAPGGST